MQKFTTRDEASYQRGASDGRTRTDVPECRVYNADYMNGYRHGLEQKLETAMKLIQMFDEGFPEVLRRKK